MTLGFHRSWSLAISPFPNLHSGSRSRSRSRSWSWFRHQTLPLQLDAPPVANETPAFLFHASVCRSERQTILPLSITWSRGIGRVVAIDNRNKKKVCVKLNSHSHSPCVVTAGSLLYPDPALPISWDRSKPSPHRRGTVPLRLGGDRQGTLSPPPRSFSNSVLNLRDPST